MQYLPYQAYVHTTFYHSSGLTRNWMFKGSIYYVEIFADTAVLLGGAECVSKHKTKQANKQTNKNKATTTHTQKQTKQTNKNKNKQKKNTPKNFDHNY